APSQEGAFSISAPAEDAGVFKAYKYIYALFVKKIGFFICQQGKGIEVEENLRYPVKWPLIKSLLF
ncbi:MAG: hypothetical protein IJZ18_05065, partial [Mailhella sp.]|nr:hypothetical protein [Mailhella sp.]